MNYRSGEPPSYYNDDCILPLFEADRGSGRVARSCSGSCCAPCMQYTRRQKSRMLLQPVFELWPTAHLIPVCLRSARSTLYVLAYYHNGWDDNWVSGLSHTLGWLPGTLHRPADSAKLLTLLRSEMAEKLTFSTQLLHTFDISIFRPSPVYLALFTGLVWLGLVFTHWRHFSGSFDLASGLPSRIHFRCIILNHFIHLLYSLYSSRLHSVWE